MKEVLVRTKPKDSFTLVVSDNSANIQTTFNPSLYLQANPDYELAMVNLEKYYSFANVRKVNNSFKWSVDDGKTWTVIHIPTGCYELKAINAEITRIRGNSEITILPNVNTLQCILTVVAANCKVSFDVSNSLASVLGFKQNIVYGFGRHASENPVNIMSVNSILVHCNIIHSSYMRCTHAPVAYHLFPNTATGQKILEAPHNLMYLTVTVDVISTLTDQHGELLDLRGEKLYVFIFVDANSMYIQHKVNVSENQVDTLKDAIPLKKGVTLCFPKGGIRGDHVLLLTPAQINRMDKVQVEGRREQIRLSARQVVKNVSYTRGFIGMLASLAARAIPLAPRVLPTILSGLTTDLLSSGINKAISGSGAAAGEGLYLHKHDKCNRVQK